jgi:hypothetical protein
MAYSDFSAREIVARFGIRYGSENLFPDVVPVIPSDWLRESLEKGMGMGFSTEKSRSERLVSPILMELSSLNTNQFSIYSGMNLDVDGSQGLNGECDFIFSFSRIQDFVTAPIFCITEAKKQDVEQGTIQCSAQLIAARKFNDLEGNHPAVLYGCSTTGIEWRFLKYENNEVTLDKRRYLVNELDTLLGVLQHIVDISQKQILFN